MTLAEFITLERLCCSFSKLSLELDPATETIWLGLTGGEGVIPASTLAISVVCLVIVVK
jgi:hypothetical protein